MHSCPDGLTFPWGNDFVKDNSPIGKWSQTVEVDSYLTVHPGLVLSTWMAMCWNGPDASRRISL